MHIDNQVFLTILAILSFFPIAAFVGFTICAGSLIIASVLLFSIFWLGVIIGGAGTGKTRSELVEKDAFSDDSILQPSFFAVYFHSL